MVPNGRAQASILSILSQIQGTLVRVRDLTAGRRFHGGLGLFFEMHRHGRGAEHLARGPGDGSGGWILSLRQTFTVGGPI